MFAVYLFSLVIMVLLINYMRFHLNLVINNNTTIEYLQAKKNNRSMTQKYNVGPGENWKQIFGSRKILWFLPVSNSRHEFQGINYPEQNQDDD